MEKECNKCGVTKSLELFTKHPKGKLGTAKCKQCYADYMRQYLQTPSGKLKVRRQHLKQKFGMTVADYDKILSSQGCACAICSNVPQPNQKRLAVDHDHKTGKIRGLLCEGCNNGLGRFDDNIASLLNAAAYLSRNTNI